MGHDIRWDNEDRTVVLQAYTEGATKDDLYYLAQESARMLKSIDHTVHLIIDERNIDLVLNSADMTYLEKLTPTNQGAVVMIVSPSKLMYKTVVQQLGKRLGPNAFALPFFAESVEQAWTFLQSAFEVRYTSEAET
ncbi:MAG: hypothetical protein H7175_02605 [Burkholderiales bacterium]|nr:hypothetical protein [Anaerolineae bacterium]